MNGDTVWVTQLDPSPASIVTTAPTVFEGVVYAGVASFEEGFAAFTPEEFFLGTNSPPRLGGEGRFSGNGVWGSAPAIDRRRNQLYVATGNNHSAPEGYHVCIAAVMAANGSEQDMLDCNDDDNYFDSVVALDLTTGAVNGSKQVDDYDTWNVACAPFLLGLPAPIPGTETNCAYDSFEAGPDFDFGQAPILSRVRGQDYVGAGQKSGIYWSLDPDDGDINWSTRTGPGGIAGHRLFAVRAGNARDLRFRTT